MEAIVLTLLFTSLLREGMPLFADLFLSPDEMTWQEASNYCQEKNGHLIVLDSQAKWDYFTAHYIDMDNVYWTGMTFNDTITCRYGEYKTPWNYNGWASWSHLYNEPNNCPDERCIRLQYNAMSTTECELLHRALCAIESSASVQPLVDSESVDSSTTANTPEADASSTVPTTTPTTLNTTDADELSTVPTTTPTTEVANVESVVSSTTPNTPEADASSTVPTTTSTTLNTTDADELSTVPTTTPTTEVANVESVVSSTTPNTPEADASSTVPTTTSTTLNTTDADELSTVPTTTTTTEVANVESVVSSTTPNTSEVDETSTYATTTDATREATATSTMSTTATPVPSGVRNDKCSKCCVKANKTRQLDKHEREEIIHLLRVQLTVNKTNLSSQRRKLISVYDSRPSSVAVGGLACAILGAIVGVIVLPDSISLVRLVYKRFQTQRQTLPILTK